MVTFILEAQFGLAGFQMYERLDRSRRAELVQSASRCLSVWMANPPLAPTPDQPKLQSTDHTDAQDGTHAAQTQQLAERQQSGFSASSSNRPHTDACSPAEDSAAAGSTPVLSSSDSNGTHSVLGQAVKGQAVGRSNGTSQHNSMATVNPPAASEPSAAAELADTTAPKLAARDTAADVDPLTLMNARSSQSVDSIKVLGDEPSTDTAILQNFPFVATAKLTAASDTDQARPDSGNAQQHADASNGVLPSIQNLNLQQGDDSDRSSSGTLSGVDVTQSEDALLDGDTEESLEGNREKAIKAETLAFQASFAQSAAVGGAADKDGADFASVSQLSDDWHVLRQGRLTASTFANALG